MSPKKVQTTCPIDGGAFVPVPARPVSADSPRCDAIQTSRDELTNKRGALEQCATCGYQRRAKDAIEAAE